MMKLSELGFGSQDYPLFSQEWVRWGPVVILEMHSSDIARNFMFVPSLSVKQLASLFCVVRAGPT
jgi:hypothetical protein